MEGMYWGDFALLLERNELPWRELRYYRSKDGFKNTISICDLTLPRRQGKPLSTTEGHERDWFRDSYICNTGYLDGWIPLVDNTPIWNEATHSWERYPVRGIRETINMLLSYKCISRTKEVRKLLGELCW